MDGNDSRATKEEGELSRLTIDRGTIRRLQVLVQRTGASGTWHRRKALEEYLDRHDVPQDIEP